MAQVRERLLRDDVGLLTLVGPAGTGKTRLALEVAAQAADCFADGVRFVDLSPVRDPERVPTTIADVLDVREKRDRAVIEALQDHLASRVACSCWITSNRSSQLARTCLSCCGPALT